MKKTITIIAALSLACGNISALDYDKIPLKEEPVNISTIKNIGGFIGDRMRLNRNTYLKHFPIEKYVEFIEARNHKDWDWTRAVPRKETFILARPLPNIVMKNGLYAAWMLMSYTLFSMLLLRYTNRQGTSRHYMRPSNLPTTI